MWLRAVGWSAAVSPMRIETKVTGHFLDAENKDKIKMAKKQFLMARFRVDSADKSVLVFAYHAGGAIELVDPNLVKTRCHPGVQTVEHVRTEIAKLYKVDFDSVKQV